MNLDKMERSKTYQIMIHGINLNKPLPLNKKFGPHYETDKFLHCYVGTFVNEKRFVYEFDNFREISPLFMCAKNLKCGMEPPKNIKIKFLSLMNPTVCEIVCEIKENIIDEDESEDESESESESEV